MQIAVLWRMLVARALWLRKVVQCDLVAQEVGSLMEVAAAQQMNV